MRGSPVAYELDGWPESAAGCLVGVNGREPGEKNKQQNHPAHL